MNQKKKWITAAAMIVAAVSLLIVMLYMQHFQSHQSLMLVMKDRSSDEIYLREPLDEAGFFSISYTHSVNKSEVEEYYCWENQQIVLYKARYHNFGAGVATEVTPEQELYYEDGFMVIDQMQVPIEQLGYRIGTISDHVLHIGEKTWHLKTLAPSLTSVVFEINPQ